MTIPIIQKIRRTNRKLDRCSAVRERRQQTAAQLLEAMKRGASLHRCNRPTRTIWVLSDGTFVTNEAAADLMASGHVVGVGDCLIGGGELSQTFRYVET
jgi:hypothetical protein